MREILFRGQTRRRGEKVKMSGEPVESNWVYGGIFPTVEGDRAIIYQQEPEIKKYPVYADTVGQYTGLKDKNGKRIFEGDIVCCEDLDNEVKFSAVVEFGNSNGELGWQLRHLFGNCFRDKCISHILLFIERDGVTCKIVGNIYDNPELRVNGGRNENMNTEAGKACKNCVFYMHMTYEDIYVCVNTIGARWGEATSPEFCCDDWEIDETEAPKIDLK